MKSYANRGIQLHARRISSPGRPGLISLVLAACLAATAVAVRAQTVASAPPSPPPALAPAAPGIPGLSKPDWLAAASVTAREGYDTNIYGTSTNLAGHPDIANVSSWFTTVSAGLTFNLLAPSGTQSSGFLNTLTLAYAADYTTYSAAEHEDNLRNTITLTIKGKSGPWILSIDNPFLYVYGSKRDQFYSTYSPLGYAPTRERRNQIQERNTSVLRYDASNWFARAVASATYYNLLIDEHNPVGAFKGYVNWVNRDDINAGVDLGYKLTPDFAFTGGWRIGQQTQARPYYSLVDNDSTYNRALLGFEGKLLPWLQLQLVAGPDLRRYSDLAHPGLAGANHTWLYTQNQITANLSSNDSLTASNKIWHWVSSSGLTSYQDTSYSLIYKHFFSRQFSASAGVSELGARYDAPTVRNDWALSYPVNATYAFNRNFSISADFTNTGGHSHLPTAITPGQNFRDCIYALSAKVTF